MAVNEYASAGARKTDLKPPEPGRVATDQALIRIVLRNKEPFGALCLFVTHDPVSAGARDGALMVWDSREPARFDDETGLALSAAALVIQNAHKFSEPVTDTARKRRRTVRPECSCFLLCVAYTSDFGFCQFALWVSRHMCLATCPIDTAALNYSAGAKRRLQAPCHSPPMLPSDELWLSCAGELPI